MGLLNAYHLAMEYASEQVYSILKRLGLAS
jgi:hypothetical protein